MSDEQKPIDPFVKRVYEEWGKTGDYLTGFQNVLAEQDAEKKAEQEFRDKTDYTEEFRPFVEAMGIPGEYHRVERSYNNETRNLTFTVETKYKENRHRVLVGIDYLSFRNRKEFIEKHQERTLFTLAVQLKRYLETL